MPRSSWLSVSRPSTARSRTPTTSTRRWEAPRSKARADQSRFSKQHNIVQNIYLRKVVGNQNKVMGIAAEQLADPGTGCKLT